MNVSIKRNLSIKRRKFIMRNIQKINEQSLNNHNISPTNTTINNNPYIKTDNNKPKVVNKNLNIDILLNNSAYIKKNNICNRSSEKRNKIDSKKEGTVDSISTFLLTKDSVPSTLRKISNENYETENNKRRASSCKSRNNRTLVFVKKSVNVDNSTIFTKTNLFNDTFEIGEYKNKKQIYNNSVDFGNNSLYYKKNIRNNFDRSYLNNIVVTNNNINLITNNNYISSTMNENKRCNNSATLRARRPNIIENIKFSTIEQYHKKPIKIPPSKHINIKTSIDIMNKDTKPNGIKKYKNNDNVYLNKINLEDFYLIIQKFEIIKNNILLLNNINSYSNKQILENINMTRIFIYDLYKFYLGSSLEGCPYNIYNDKMNKLYLHFYSIVLILSLGLIYIIVHKIKMTIDYKENILTLISFQLKSFLILCDDIINKRNNDNNDNDIWTQEIIYELKRRKILNSENHLLKIKKLSIDSYNIFNVTLSSLCLKKSNKIQNQEVFLFKHFHNRTLNYLAQIKIHDIEQIFNKNIFKQINLKSNFANITSLKNSINNRYIIRSQNNKYIADKNYDLKGTKPKVPYLNFPSKKELTLILDLDETLINFKIINAQKGIGQMHLRPGLINFLDVIKEYYEIIIFTSGTRDYADLILDVIENKKKYFAARLYREHAIKNGNKYIKDLSKLGRDLSKTIIVDNFPQSFKFQHENGILISSFYADDKDDIQNDRALINLQKILIKIYKDKSDVRLSILKYKEEIIRNVSCLGMGVV